MPEARFLSNPTQTKCRVGSDSNRLRKYLRDGIYAPPSDSRVSQTRQIPICCIYPILRSTALRLYGVTDIMCLRHISAIGAIPTLKVLVKSATQKAESFFLQKTVVENKKL